ncbi:MAG: 4-(cytidine 5'-diphospho)-2-C-methyl-D-erythritol kinase [Pseudomonadales bacterium]|nr:4-(cytidine 5'-diphospho)-2-C-methyl-D-erythritol kinase [Pseudomonadales bacterium]
MFSLPAPCKLNLCLLITGRRANGYHELQTAFQLLDFGDDISFAMADELIINEPGEVRDDSLVRRAALALQEKSGTCFGAAITLRKKTPIGAGLGGGSSDAATVLLGLNHLWQTGFSLTELADIGLALGADVPVFVHGRSAWAEGVGEKITPLSLPEKWFVVVQPGCQIATGEIFSNPGLTRNSSPITIARFLETGAGNDCESVVKTLYPEVAEAFSELGQYGPVQLTGTGSCVYLVFESEAEGARVLERVPSRWKAFLARGLNTSPLHLQLDMLSA